MAMSMSYSRENERPISILTICQRIQHNLENCLSEHNVKFDGLKVCKRWKDIKSGDVGVSKYPALVTICTTGDSKSFLQDLQNRLTDDPACFIKSVQINIHSGLTFSLDRENVFSQTIRHVVCASHRYGHRTHCRQGRVLINTVDFHGSCIPGEHSMPTADSLHSLLVAQHSEKLFAANGYEVSYIQFNDLSKEFVDLAELLGVSISKASEPQTNMCEYLLEIARKSEYLKENDLKETGEYKSQSTASDTCSEENKAGASKTVTRGDIPFQEDHKNVHCGQRGEPDKMASLVLDVSLYMEKQKIHQGKGKFDKTLCLVEVSADGHHFSNILKQVALLENIHIAQNEDNVVVLHVVSQRQAFSQQKVHLLWNMLSQHSGKISQVHLVAGAVKSRKSCDVVESISASDVFQLHYKQMEEASVMKYGDDVYHSSGWEDTIMSLSVASIKFEFLSSNCKNMIKLDLSQKDTTRSGSFVMYNCARLSTLFTHFQEAVENGVYPPLPAVEEIDFSTLKGEEEWALLYNYVLPFPDVVSSTVEEFLPISGEIQANIHTHKVCTFLQGLSRSISSYYSRTHILGECVPHLLPVMYARLYLMKAVHQVMQKALELMGITPLAQL